MQHITSVALPLAQPPPCAAPSDGDGASSSSSSRPTGTRILYIILSANSNSSNLRLAAIEKGWLRSVNDASRDVFIVRADNSLVRRDANTLVGSIDGRLLFDALRTARAQRGPADWYMMADDDTHVDPDAIIDFVQHSDPSLAYGNLYNFRNATRGDPKTFLPKYTCGGVGPKVFPLNRDLTWFTGGSGVLLPASVVDRIASANDSDIAAWGSVAKQCKCFDVPLACAIQDLGVTIAHRPDRFLDSCLACTAFLPTAPRRILSCHNSEAFSGRSNPHATHKGPWDNKDLRGVMKLHTSGYKWPAYLSHVPPLERMQEVRRGLCAPRGAGEADCGVFYKTQEAG